MSETDRFIQSDGIASKAAVAPCSTSRNNSDSSGSSTGGAPIAVCSNSLVSFEVGGGNSSSTASLNLRRSGLSGGARTKKEVINDPSVDVHEWKKKGT